MNIEVYSTETCHWCKKTKEYFKQLGVEYTNYAVDQDEKKAMEMVEKTGQMGVPVIVIDNEVIIGFDKNRIDAIFKDKGILKE